MCGGTPTRYGNTGSSSPYGSTGFSRQSPYAPPQRTYSPGQASVAGTNQNYMDTPFTSSGQLPGDNNPMAPGTFNSPGGPATTITGPTGEQVSRVTGLPPGQTFGQPPGPPNPPVDPGGTSVPGTLENQINAPRTFGDVMRPRFPGLSGMTPQQWQPQSRGMSGMTPEQFAPQTKPMAVPQTGMTPEQWQAQNAGLLKKQTIQDPATYAQQAAPAQPPPMPQGPMQQGQATYNYGAPNGGDFYDKGSYGWQPSFAPGYNDYLVSMYQGLNPSQRGQVNWGDAVNSIGQLSGTPYNSTIWGRR